MTPTESTTDAALDTVDVAEQSAETVEAPVEGQETTETSTEEAPPVAGQPYKAVTQNEKGQTVLDAKAKQTIEELRAKDPALAKVFRDALFEADRFSRALPGGLKEVQELRNTVEQLGGEHGIEEIKQRLEGWDGFDNQYMAGDPKALEFMLSTPESQQAFMKLAPMAFNKFEELNPEGYASYLCQRIVGDAVANRVPIAMELAQHYLAAGDAQKAAEQFGQVVKWFQGLDATAKKPVEAAKTQQAPDPRVKELEQQNEGFVREQWRQETAKEQSNIYVPELNRLLAGRKITINQREDIEHRVRFKLDERKKEILPQLEKYYAAKDRDGFLKFAISFSKKHIPELLREAVDRYVPQKPGPKVQAVPQGGQPLRPPVNGAKPEAGFTQVDKIPTNLDWSNPFNTRANVASGKGIDVNGRRLKWK